MERIIIATVLKEAHEKQIDAAYGLLRGGAGGFLLVRGGTLVSPPL